MSTMSYQVQQAIEDSIREGVYVCLEAPLDSQRWVDLCAELTRLAEDCCEITDPEDGTFRRDYAGSDHGDVWSVTVLAR